MLITGCTRSVKSLTKFWFYEDLDATQIFPQGWILQYCKFIHERKKTCYLWPELIKGLALFSIVYYPSTSELGIWSDLTKFTMHFLGKMGIRHCCANLVLMLAMCGWLYLKQLTWRHRKVWAMPSMSEL